MKVLFVDTTTADLVCAVVTEKEIVDGSQKNVGTHHSEVLCDVIGQLLAKANVTFADLDAYAVAQGPGSFTGIRIGIATVKGYATAVKKPFLEVCTLEAIALSKHCHARKKAVIDAGNGYYFADYKKNVAPCLISYDDKSAKRAGKSTLATEFLDGSAQIVRRDFALGKFVDSVSPLYIRRSQAEELKTEGDK